MKQLLMKEIKLTASPLTWFFIAFCGMTMIPGYPILVGAFFVCLGIFYTFQFGREFNDTLYTALLPVQKRDVVKAKYVFTVFIQLICLVLDAGLTAVRMTFLQGAVAYTGNPLMNANLAYMGYVMLVFALFNLVFLPGFFKTGYYIGKPFITYCVAAFVMIGVGEALHWVPGLTLLNATGAEGLGLQCIVLAVGAVVYVAGTVFSLRVSQNRFERIDL